MSPTLVKSPDAAAPRTCAEGPCPEGPRSGSFTRCVFCITVTNVSLTSIMWSPLDVAATVVGPPSSKAPAAPPHATLTVRGASATLV